MRFVLLVPIFILFTNCTNDERSGISLIPEIKDTDSVEVLYFNDPDNQRFYTYLSLQDKDFIGALIKDLEHVAVREKTENSCDKEGKIYMHKNGKIFNTVFFSYNDDSCQFLRFIKNGRLYHFPIRESLRDHLRKLKFQAKDPETVLPQR